MHKITESGPAFCVCAGGMSVYILYSVNLTTSLVSLVLSILFFAFCGYMLSKGGIDYRVNKPIGALTGIYAVISASVSITLSTSLIIKSQVMNEKFYPLILLLTGIFAVCFGMTKRDCTVYVSFIMGLAAAVVLAVLIFLCLLRTDFSMPDLGKIQPNALLLLTAFSVCDIILVLPLHKGRPSMLLKIGSITHIYGAAMTVLSISVLSKEVFYMSDMPWLTLWRSTFISSFLNSFEVMGVCAFFILNAIKAAVGIKAAVDIWGRKYIVFIMLAMFAAAAALWLYSNLISAAAVVSVAAGILLPAASLLARSKIKQP